MALPLSKTSVTAELLKLRAPREADVKTGEWHAGFTKVKTFAEANNFPFVAIWTNGDKCGNCVKLEKCFLDQSFIDWQKKSGCVFWLGTGDDTDDEDKRRGSGYKWIYQNGKITTYPFVRIYWLKGNVDVTMTGNDLDGGHNPSEGTKSVIDQLNNILVAWKPPVAAPAKPATPPPAPKAEPAPAKPAAPAPEKKPVASATPAPSVKKEEAKKELRVKFNPELSKDEIAKMQADIKDNGGYCPCQETKEPSTKCMCQSFRDMSKPGKCICGLYVKYYA